jgi:hypothetical protein
MISSIALHNTHGYIPTVIIEGIVIYDFLIKILDQFDILVLVVLDKLVVDVRLV